MTIYVVSLYEGSMCLKAGLNVEFKGHEAHVSCEKHENEIFWSQRLAFLRSNPNN